MTAAPLTPRYPEVPPGAGHYESFYFTATDPDQRRALWVRHTVHRRPGQAATASLWVTFFTPDGPRAAKTTLARIEPQSGPGIELPALASVDAAGARGALAGDALRASWELAFVDPEPALEHLSRPWMYRSPLPRTKATSPIPDLRLRGTITIDGTVIDATGWRGMLGHNWGSEHAHRWIWLRAAGFPDAPQAWLDVVLGRIKLGPATSPWIANGVLSLDGERRRVGGARRYPKIRERADGCDLDLAAPGVDLRIRVTAPRELSVGWVYADPAGGTHQVRNCSIAGITLTVTRNGTSRTLDCDHGGVYELGTTESDPALTMQPFADG